MKPCRFVLHTLDAWNIGGIQEMVLNLAKHSRHGHDAWGHRGTMSPYLDQAGVITWAGGPPEAAHYDVLVGHTVGGWSHDELFGWARARGLKTVEVMHSEAASPTRPALVDLQVCLSRRAAERNAHMPRREVIYAPVDTGALGQTRVPAYVGKLSRLVREKGTLEFLEIARAFPHQRFCLAGDGDLRPTLERQRPANLDWLGWVRDFGAFYRQLALFVFPTQDECCCVSVAMAQAAGVPVVCQDLPALRETTGGHALFCRSVSEFVGQLARLLERPDRPALLAQGQEAQAWARAHFGLDTTVTTWDQLLDHLSDS